jgi:ketosteroid isomerase-like protein
MGNAATVQAIYEAFGRGDIETILSHLADDVRWEEWDDNCGQNAGVPELQPRRGKAEVPQFFGVVAGFDIKEFEILSVMEGPNQVAAEVVIDALTPTGRFRDEEVMLWTFDDTGRVVRMRHYTDTAKHMRAAGL